MIGIAHREVVSVAGIRARLLVCVAPLLVASSCSSDAASRQGPAGQVPSVDAGAASDGSWTTHAGSEAGPNPAGEVSSVDAGAGSDGSWTTNAGSQVGPKSGDAATVSGVPSRGIGWFGYPGAKDFASSFDHFVSVTGITPKLLLSFAGSFKSMPEIQAYNDQHAATWAAEPRVNAASGMVPVFGVTLQTTQNDMTLANIPTGAADGFFDAIVKSWASRGYKELWVRLSYEQNYPATTPSNENGQNAFAGGAPGEPQYAPLAIAAFRHAYTKLHAAGLGSGIVVQVIWNPTLINWDNASPTTYYPGAEFVDIESVDLYTNSFWGPATQLTVPGYNSQPAFALSFTPPGGTGVETNLKTWASNYDNVAWAMDFEDATSLPYKVGNGWSLYTAMKHALSTRKSFMFPEYGTISSCDGGGNGGLVDANGLAMDVNLAAWTRKRIAWFQAQGGDFLTMDLWQCLGDAMLKTYGQVWPHGGTE